MSYSKNPSTSTAKAAAATASASVAKTKQKQQKHKITLTKNAKNATEIQIKQTNLNPNKSTTTTNTTTKVLTYLKPATQTPLIKKYVGNAARRQTLAHQIKRAHRHLLTSGGNDKQPPKQQKRNNNQTCTLRDKQSFCIECQAFSALFGLLSALHSMQNETKCTSQM